MKRGSLKYLTRRERRALAEYLARLREQFGDQVQRVILYGSKVRGDFDAESDIDLFVVFKELDQTREDVLSRLVLDVDLKYDVLVSDFLVNQARFERMAKIHEPLYQDVMGEGVDLWTRTPKLLWASVSKKPRTMSRARASSSRSARIAKRSVARTMRSLP
ncbi:MAG: nucleotidyltransferase domain-containing protein [Chloroflexi bacterium]|nr:nucleotidyltransferase domain-containing protein [Chloroflexota bacterium]